MAIDMDRLKGDVQYLGTAKGSGSIDERAYQVMQGEAAHTVPNNENTAPVPAESEGFLMRIRNKLFPKKS